MRAPRRIAANPPRMKTQILATLTALVIGAAFTGCETTVEAPATTSTTTTETSSVHSPVVGSSTETRTMRTY